MKICGVFTVGKSVVFMKSAEYSPYDQAHNQGAMFAAVAAGTSTALRFVPAPYTGGVRGKFQFTSNTPQRTRST